MRLLRKTQFLQTWKFSYSNYFPTAIRCHPICIATSMLAGRLARKVDSWVYQVKRESSYIASLTQKKKNKKNKKKEFRHEAHPFDAVKTIYIR